MSVGPLWTQGQRVECSSSSCRPTAGLSFPCMNDLINSLALSALRPLLKANKYISMMCNWEWERKEKVNGEEENGKDK